MKLTFGYVLSILCLSILLWVPGTRAAQIAPALEKQMVEQPDTMVRTLVVLCDQVDIRKMDADLRNQGASLARRHETVLRALKTTAEQTQVGLIADLENARTNGLVTGYATHWLINAVMVEARPEAVRDLADRPEVDRLEPELISKPAVDPAKGLRAAPQEKALGGPTAGVEALRVPEVWHNLGITGGGQIVGLMDTGVDGAHQALSANWRGNTAPASESWLDIAGLGSPGFPIDPQYNGTLLAGYLVGHAPGDTVGVAPGAEWIASNFLWQPIGPQFDADFIASLEWMADPDGNPTTVHDMPAVVVNGWGINESYSGYFDCDSRWWAALDAAEAAGLVLVFVAGDTGPDSGTILSPADYAATETSGFSVGSVKAFAPYTVAYHSARGPSGCGTEWSTKPEVVAPGVDAKSTYPGNQYSYYSSTVASAGYVAGVVALMREANPNADAETIKQTLLNTAVDQDLPGDDNVSGRGMVDAYAAVLEMMAGRGTAGGIVADQNSGLPLEGAVLTAVGSGIQATTNSQGRWSHVLPAGSYTFAVNLPDYYAGSLSFTKTDSVDTVADLDLVPRPRFQVSGTVTGPDAQPVAGAVVRNHTSPTVTATADSNGQYSLDLAGGVDLTHNLAVWGPDAGLETASFSLDAPLVQDLVLPAKLGDGFESGDFSRYQWSSPGAEPWIVDTTNPRSGMFSAHTDFPVSGDPTSLFLEFWSAEAGTLTFDLQVHNNPGHDYLTFHMDGDHLKSWTGELPWASYSYYVPQGHHVFEWRHEAYYFIEDPPRVWLDNVVLPPTGVEPLAVLELDIAELQLDVPENQTADGTFHVTNQGTHPLDIALQVEPAAKAAGGPDAWGYTWRDSDEPGGPVFDWVDITTDGWASGLGNEDIALEVDIGFPFLFYGQIHEEVNVSANGFLSFVSTSPGYFNRVIPTSTQPNGLIGPFWDDLNPGTGVGEVWWKSEPENGRFIVSWEAVDRDGTSVPETFQAILHADGRIDFQYQVVNNPSSCTVGIEDQDGLVGSQVVWNDAGYLHSGMAITFDPVPLVDWVTCTPWYARIEPGQTLPVNVEVDASSLSIGVRAAVVHLYSNDRSATESLVTVTATVKDVSGVSETVPGRTAFIGAVPNPFNPKTRITFSLARSGPVQLDVHDVRGRRIRRLTTGDLSAGEHTVVWDGTDDSGRGQAAGVYFVRLQAQGGALTHKVTLVK